MAIILFCVLVNIQQRTILEFFGQSASNMAGPSFQNVGIHDSKYDMSPIFMSNKQEMKCSYYL